MSIKSWWDRITGKAELRREYIERINEIYHKERKLYIHLLKLYPDGHKEGFHGAPHYEFYIEGIIGGSRKVNPKPQYTEEELKQYQEEKAKQKHDGVPLMDWAKTNSIRGFSYFGGSPVSQQAMGKSEHPFERAVRLASENIGMEVDKK